MTSRGAEVGVAVALVLAYAAHALVWARRGAPENALWACHVAALLVAGGLLARHAGLAGAGFLWAVLGLGCWILDLARGGELIPSSLGTHGGAMLGGLFGVRRLGLPSGTWWRATLGILGLHLVSRLLTPAASNVNVSAAVWAGWEGTFPSHPAYVALLTGLAAIVFRAMEALVRSERRA